MNIRKTWRKRFMGSCTALTTLFSLAGCGAGTDGQTSIGTSSADPAAGQATVSVSGFTHASDGAPLGGVDVCTRPAHGITSSAVRCVTSGSDGAWEMRGLPPHGQVALTFEKEGFEATLRVFEVGTEDLALPADDIRLAPRSDTFMGVSADPTRGQLEFFIDSDGSDSPRASVSLIDSKGKTLTAIYLRDDGAPDSNATAGNHGGFADLPAGEYLLVVHGQCSASDLYGYPLFENPDVAPDGAVLDALVIAGHVTTPIRVSCTNTPPVTP
jgi:hypothetical protein